MRKTMAFRSSINKRSTYCLCGIFIVITLYFIGKTVYTSSINSSSPFATKPLEPVERGVLSMIENIIKSDTSPQGPVEVENMEGVVCNDEKPHPGIEDLLCKEPPNVLKNYKNPCWVENGNFVCLPYFQLIGVGKCGTTDLFGRITMHPDILENDGFYHKETMWWCCKRYGYQSTDNLSQKRPFGENFQDYQNYFSAAAKEIRDAKAKEMITGDGSPRDSFALYDWVDIPQNQGLNEPEYLTPHLIRHMNPGVKLIIILRDPVDRLYTDFHFKKNKNGVLTTEGFDLESGNRFLTSTVARGNPHSAGTRVNMGFYSVFLRDWLRVFPREQLLILRAEDYYGNTEPTLREIFRYLGVRDLSPWEMSALLNMTQQRVTLSKKNAGPMLDKTRAMLMALYQPFNDKLATLIGDQRYTWQKQL